MIGASAWSRRPRGWLLLLVATLTCLTIVSLGLAPSRAQAADKPPLLAYYYIWYDASSWDRAKSDYPLLGRYSSDDRAVMEQHVKWAKAAGIGGFIVSWKSTEKLDRRLAQLRDVAAEQNFKLAIIFQGLDFDRKPLDINRIAADFDYFAQTYGKDPVFSIFGKPLVVWSGTWEYTPQQVASVTSLHRQDLLMLASEKNVRGYERLARWVDGDSYYWSSVDPATYPDYQGKLNALSQAVHRHGGLWIAPASVGFDARLIGGTRIVARGDGQNLRTQMNAATRSSPDAIGLISWNEYSENSHVEPSVNFGPRFLSVLSDIRGAQPPDVGGLSGSAPEPAATPPGAEANIEKALALGLLMGVIGIGAIATILRRRRPAGRRQHDRS